MTAAQWLNKAKEYFLVRCVPESSANAEFILAHVLRLKRNEVLLHGQKNMAAIQAREFWRLVRRRAQRVPLAYVLGSQPFLDFNLDVGPGALIPRPETEEVALAAIQFLASALSSQRGERGGVRGAVQILDLGTGTGCLAIALARAFPQAEVCAVDVSPEALTVARRNVKKQNLSSRIRLIRRDFRRFELKRAAWADLVVSNPPYIPSVEIKNLSPEVLREPRLALDGGKHGLQAPQDVIRCAKRALKFGGALVMEIGWNQGAQIRGLLKASGFESIEVRCDMQGQERIVIAKNLLLPPSPYPSPALRERAHE